MTRVQRRLIWQTAQLGLLLTLLVIIADRLGWLEPMERYLFDLRARHCQLFTPNPSYQIIHLDIDDESLQQIGRWPWPRSVLGELIDEIRLAGPKIIALDILLDQAQEPQVRVDESGKVTRIDHDQNLADAIRRAGNVLLPVSINFEQSSLQSALYQSLVELLSEDLERDVAELEPLLRARGISRGDLKLALKDQFLQAQEQATFTRIESELLRDPGLTLEDVLSRLVPRAMSADERTNARILVESAYPTVLAILRTREFGAPKPEQLAALIGNPQQATIPVLANVAAHVGFVDFLSEADGVVRTLPLAADYRGQMLPHMSLAVACAMLGVDPRSIQYHADRIIVRPPNSKPIVIPVRAIWSRRFGEAGLMMDIPWFGSTQWEYMYDHPRASQTKQHEPLRNVWRIRELSRSIDANDAKLLDALSFLHEAQGSEELERFRKQWPQLDQAARRSLIEQLTQDELLSQYHAIYEQMRAGDLDETGQRFLASWRAIEQIPRRNVFLQSRVDQDRIALKNELRDRAVFVGWTATGRTDTYPTSLHAACPGMVIQGVVTNAILSRQFWEMSGWRIGAGITLGMGLLTTAIVALFSAWRALVLTIFLVAGYLAFNGFVLFDYFNWIVAAAAPVTAAVIVWSGLTLARSIYEAAERARITRRFSSYVDPAVVTAALEHPESVRLDGQVKEMTVVFTDLAGFTTLSERLRERTVGLLNQYMSLMLPIIRENHGVWNKFLGDGIMFFYNAPLDDPNHARNAVRTVLQMQDAVTGFNVQLARDGLPHVSMRAGISSGLMVVGDAGSTDPQHHASDYTVLGDEVNLGARLESANKALGSKILVSQRTFELLGDEFLLRPMGNLRVVGKTEGVQTWEAVCPRRQASEAQLQLVELSRSVVERFCAAEFDPCMNVARDFESRFGSSKFSQLYIDLSRRYLTEPPAPGFNGQIVLEEK